MSSKRPLQSNTVGNSFNGSKKIKQDFDNFKAPQNKNGKFTSKSCKIMKCRTNFKYFSHNWSYRFH